MSFLVEGCTMPFCKGCGHTHVIRKLNEALVQLKQRPEDVCLTTDIGCIGLADALFATPHTVHTTHGRSTAFATGIELADSILAGSRLKNIVLIGDGGAMIGLLHLVNAALLNVDVTVLLCNNFLFGMTGGQNSAFSPMEFVTPTTPKGNIIPPIDLCKILTDAHAGLVARKLSTDKDLTDTIAQAIAHPGFAVVEIVELCTEHGTTRNELSGTAIRGILEKHGQQLGLLHTASDRKEFGAVYAQKFPRQSAAERPAAPLQSRYETALRKKIGIIVSGSAGERIQSSAGMFIESAALAGLHCTQKNDNPVTQGSGFSLAEICISPTEIYYTGIDRPDVVIGVSPEGLDELREKGLLSRLTPSTTLILDSSLDKPETAAEIYRMPFRSLCGGEKAAAAALAFYLQLSKIFPFPAFDDLLKRKYKSERGIFPDQFYATIRNIDYFPVGTG